MHGVKTVFLHTSLSNERLNAAVQMYSSPVLMQFWALLTYNS